jgi:hypothetical protein
VDGVREVNRLIERLFKSEYWNRLPDPARNNERCYYTHNCNYTETTEGQYRYEHLG